MVVFHSHEETHPHPVSAFNTAFVIAIIIAKGLFVLLQIIGASFANSTRLNNHSGARGVHDLHVWALSTKENALSVHLWMPDEPFSDDAPSSCDDSCTPYL